jgi:carbon-monoxide dehydrogenase small subunit
MIETLAFTLNRKPVSLRVDGDRPLLWVLRTDLGLTGAKFGCGEGLCGACTVLINNEAVPACQTSVSAVAGSHVKTIEGLAASGQLHPIQEAFGAHDALQCGFCTPIPMSPSRPCRALRRNTTFLKPE